jgi:hypothetical protein
VLPGLRVLALMLALAGCGSAEEATQAPSSEPANTVSGTTLDGETVSLADFRGTPVFVNVWSSW